MRQLVFLIAITVFLLPGEAFSQSKSEMRAKEGENVMLIINYVKDEVKDDYETFMEDVFFKAITSSKLPKMDEQYLKSRWLVPTRKNDDNTWTYVFLMDPFVKDGNYQFEPLFEETHSKAEAAAIIKKYESFMGTATEFHFLTQSKH